MTVLLLIALLIAVATVPIMIGARVVGARNTGFGSAVLTAFVLAGLSALTNQYVVDDLLYFVVVWLAGAGILTIMLETTYMRALGVSIIISGIQFLAIALTLGAYLTIS